MNDLSIIILSYNTSKYTLNCLKSLKNQNLDLESSGFEVIVSDNGSQDETVEEVRKLFPWVKVLENHQNLGFAAGNNRAIKLAKGQVILLLNSDTVVAEDTLISMLSLLKERKDVGAASPRVELPDGSLDLACHRGFPTPWNALCYFLGLERLFPNSRLFSGYHQTYKDFNIPHDVDVISGACLFIKREAIEKIGLLDERFFMYAEDIDWCMRLKKAGWRIFYNPETKIIHYKKKSGRERELSQSDEHHTNKIKSETTNHFYETMKLFYDKHYSKKYPKSVTNLVHFGISLLAKVKLIKNKIR